MKQQIVLSVLLLMAVANNYVCHAQTTEDIDKSQVNADPVPVPEIQKLFSERIKIKHFQKPMVLEHFLRKVRELLKEKKKYVWVDVDIHAFVREYPDVGNVSKWKVKLPRFPPRIRLDTVLKLAISQIPTGNANLYLMQSRIIITTTEQMMSPKNITLPVSGSYDSLPLGKVIDEFSDQTGVAIVVDTQMKRKVETPIRAVFCETPLNAALQLLTKTTGLQHVQVGNAVLVTSPKKSRKIRAFLDTPKAVVKKNMIEKRPPFHSPSLLAVDTCALLETRVSRFTIKEKPIGNVLMKLAHDESLPFVIDNRIGEKAKTRISAHFPNPVTAKTALILLTEMAGLKYRIVDDVVFVSTPKYARRLEKRRTTNQ